MDIKKVIGFKLLILVLCSCNGQTDNLSTEVKTDDSIEIEFKKGQIIFSTSNRDWEYETIRLYPGDNSIDSVKLKEILKRDVVSIEKSKDTIFAFFNNEKLAKVDNKCLPKIDLALLQNYYPKFYNVSIEDDIPNHIYLKNEKDFLHLTQHDEEYTWEKAIITDTLLSILDLKVGLNKDEAIKALGLPKLSYPDNFNLILCQATEPSKIWYKKLIETYGLNKHTYLKDVFANQILVKFSKNKIELIKISPWIPYIGLDEK
ncbi:hypothetical protein OO013_08020 [Mangrovivirga sp. M17]|uniref:Lipoprotein n=1 Tax=Mangrovivirga halotolerans TaxID=2993936 RepID=A0ABT3RPU5_9BACT|nr:hypothetical protein [Mangrovivirga halotolerans]MCX2743807.1 hypothetical protein [Mangrovivirga halotolerans]